jgi:CspA family cold shock protein
LQRGWVKWFNENRGYGFIRQEEGGNILVHYSDIEGEGFRTLSEGECVEFEIEEKLKGLHAVKVRKLGYSK